MGQLGIGSEIVNKNLPTEIQAFQEEDLVQITAFGDVSAAVSVNGQVFTWGKTKATSMDHPQQVVSPIVSQITNLSLPTPVEAQGLVFTRVACGKTHIVAITNNGKL